MAINITITGLTTQQSQDVGNAFDQTIAGRADSGMNKSQWVERQLLIFIKSVVKGWKRQGYEAQLTVDQTQIDTDYQ